MPQANDTIYNHVLVVDDSEVDVLIVKKIIQLTHLAKHTHARNSGQSALEFLTVTPPTELPEVIFLDLNMPVMNGLEFLKVFESLPDIIRKTCRIVILSSSNHKSDLIKVLESPFVKKVITKPLTMDMIHDWALPA
jgi:CheY-like chemotaxis protein